MKKSSNEPKNERQWHEVVKATLKVVLKRYFLVPCFLYLCNMIGSIVISTDSSLKEDPLYTKNCISTIFYNVGTGFIVIFFFCIALITLIVLIKPVISSLRQRTFIQDIQGLWFKLLHIIVWIAKGIIRLPKIIYNRIREEPKRFKEDVKKQEMKQKEKENNEQS